MLWPLETASPTKCSHWTWDHVTLSEGDGSMSLGASTVVREHRNCDLLDQTGIKT